ncbi:MAG: hypothetical protein K2O18_00470, partial [Oscillospiraceae bacterium]|nr:hypothetical protein [Oscillospiraceae bacterium]
MPNKAVWYAESKLAFAVLYSLVVFCRTAPKKIENSPKINPEIYIKVIPDKINALDIHGRCEHSYRTRRKGWYCKSKIS